MSTPTLQHVINRLNRIEERLVAQQRLLEAMAAALVDTDQDEDDPTMSLDGPVEEARERDQSQPL